MAERKAHPSEALEFISIVPSSTADHVEDVTNTSRHDGDTSKTGFYQPQLSKVPTISTATTSFVSAVTSATQAEHRMTVLQGLQCYPKAIGWSFLLSSTIIMEGYDTALISGFFAFPEFKKAYGHRASTGDYEVTTAWQSALQNGAIVGEIIGLFLNGVFTEKFGYRYTMIGALLGLCAFVFLAFFGFNIGMLLASEVLCGMSWGVFQTLSTTYAAEVMPVSLRAYLTSNVHLCWRVGQMIALGILRAKVQDTSAWSYRVPFGLQWMWAVPILIGVFFAPESPWWLLRHSRDDDAKQALLRLTNRNVNAEDTIAMMKHTNELEKSTGESTSYRACLSGPNRRRTAIVSMVWAIQALCGNTLTTYATYFMVAAGLPTTKAFDLTLGMYAMTILGTFLSWLLMRVLGRRTLYLAGLALMCITLFAAGAVASQPNSDSPVIAYTLATLIIIFTFFYDSTIGPVCYSLVSETPSTRLRVKSVVISRVSYNLITIVANVLMPKMLNPTAWNWKGKTCFLWAVSNLLCFVWCWFFLPEPKGLTYLELDVLFDRGAAARKFGRLRVKLAESGYFSLEDGEEEKDEWHGSVG